MSYMKSHSAMKAMMNLVKSTKDDGIAVKRLTTYIMNTYNERESNAQLNAITVVRAVRKLKTF